MAVKAACVVRFPERDGLVCLTERQKRLRGFRVKHGFVDLQVCVLR